MKKKKKGKYICMWVEPWNFNFEFYENRHLLCLFVCVCVFMIIWFDWFDDDDDDDDGQ